MEIPWVLLISKKSSLKKHLQYEKVISQMKRIIMYWKSILCYYVLFLNNAEHFAKRERTILIFQR